MRGLKLVEPEMRRIVIQQAIHRAEDARYAHRLHGLLLVTGGQSCRQVADLFGADRRTVQRWVKTYERNGLEGLREGARAGRPRALGAQQWQAVAADLRQSPTTFGLNGNLWDGKLLSEHVGRRYGVRLGVRQCQRLFKQLGFRCRKPRPQVAQADPEQVQAFKKTGGSGRPRGR